MTKFHYLCCVYMLDCTSTFVCRRNQNYHDILKGMGALKHKNLSQFDLTNQFTHLFFLGDLNYRIDQLSATEIVEYAKKMTIFQYILMINSRERWTRRKFLLDLVSVYCIVTLKTEIYMLTLVFCIFRGVPHFIPSYISVCQGSKITG